MLYLSANASIGMTAVSEIRILPTYKYFRNCGKTSTQHGSSFNSITLSRHSFHSGFMSITWNTSLLAHKITRWAGYLFSPTTKHISDINCSAYMLAILCKTLVALFIWKWWNFFLLWSVFSYFYLRIIKIILHFAYLDDIWILIWLFTIHFFQLQILSWMKIPWCLTKTNWSMKSNVFL